jgi:hypothetical protein
MAIKAAPIAKIENRHTFEGCDYYDIVIYDDNGTPDDPSDDTRLGGGTIKDCDRVHTGSPTNGINTNIRDTYVDPNLGCLVYIVELENSGTGESINGVIGSDDCQ